MLDGALYRGWAELGHIVVVADGPPCQGNCTGRGHLEAVASGSAADERAEKLWGEGATAELLVGRASRATPKRSRRSRGSAICSALRSARFVNIFGPELVVIGGGFGIAAAEYLFLEPRSRWRGARRCSTRPAQPADRQGGARLGRRR